MPSKSEPALCIDSSQNTLNMGRTEMQDVKIKEEAIDCQDEKEGIDEDDEDNDKYSEESSYPMDLPLEVITTIEPFNYAYPYLKNMSNGVLTHRNIFTEQERDVLKKIVDKYREIVDTRSRTREIYMEKQSVWQQIVEEYNSTENILVRTEKELKKCWDNMKYRARQAETPLVAQLKSLVNRLHSPPLWKSTDILVTPGSQDGLCKAIEMMLSPDSYFITQEPCYSGTLAILAPYTPKLIPVECDADGMIPDALRESLSAWDPVEMRKQVDGVPKVIYVNPTACNPSGATLTSQRRREIYDLACQYDLVILEDDPYYFVQFDDVENFAPSFLSLDVEGRVLRFDSFSKVLSSGVRLGFVTGPAELIRGIMLHMQASVLHTSSLSQVLVSELLSQWGEEGFLRHTAKVQEFYKERRDCMVRAAKKHLTGLCEWSVPGGGMFLWMKVPGVRDTWDMVMKRGLSKQVLLVPGRAFRVDPAAPCNYLRAAFSLTTPERMDVGMQSLAELIREEIEIYEA